MNVIYVNSGNEKNEVIINFSSLKLLFTYNEIYTIEIDIINNEIDRIKIIDKLNSNELCLNKEKLELIPIIEEIVINNFLYSPEIIYYFDDKIKKLINKYIKKIEKI